MTNQNPPDPDKAEIEQPDALRKLRREHRRAWIDSMIRAEQKDYALRQAWLREHPFPERHGSLRDNLWAVKRKAKFQSAIKVEEPKK